MSKFQIIVIGIFVVFIIVGVVLFATFKSSKSGDSLPTITIWGTFPGSVIADLVEEVNSTRAVGISVNYVQRDEANFDRDFIEALARGQGPDAILIPQDMLIRHEDKLTAIPSNILTERDFKDSYIPQAELYLNANREPLALPFTIDPLMMYWNRDIFTNAGFATYPRYWDEFPALIAKINLKDANSNLRRSAIAMGEFVNINNAREILGALLLQAGNPVTARGNASSGGRITSALGDGQFAGVKYSIPAVEFFTQFSNPRNSYYSWNRALPLSKSSFLSGSLATYFGFASELLDLRAKNPNIDYDVAPLPQARNGQNRVTYGVMYGFSIVARTPDPLATFTTIQALTSPQALVALGKISKLPPVRRDIIAAGTTDPYQTIFYDSALISRSWLDVSTAKTSSIFQTMIESVTSGRSEVYQALQTAHGELDLLLQNP